VVRASVRIPLASANDRKRFEGSDTKTTKTFHRFITPSHGSKCENFLKKKKQNQVSRKNFVCVKCELTSLNPKDSSKKVTKMFAEVISVAVLALIVGPSSAARKVHTIHWESRNPM
jgi:hypothetical protein